MAYALGIDLGTSYSAAAVARAGGRVEIFQLGAQTAAIPSIVLLRSDGETLVGEAAERRSLQEPARTAREFKRRLGDPVPLILGGTPYSPASLLTIVLRSIVAQVRAQEGEAPSSVVVTHPAAYGPYKLELLGRAAHEADIGPITFLPEPQAAAMHYAHQERVPLDTVIGVYDFGGGTFDATILRKTEDGFETLGEPEGLERLGGVDFDQAVFAHVAEAVGPRFRQFDPSEPSSLVALGRLREESRRAKEALSSDTDAVVPVYLPDGATEVRLTRAEFEAMIRPRVGESISALERAVRSAGLSFADLDRILLVGGTSRIPLVGEMVRSVTGRPLSIDVHPKHAVALGAALTALPRTFPPTQDLPTATVAAPPADGDPQRRPTEITAAPIEPPRQAAPKRGRLPLFATVSLAVVLVLGLALMAVSGILGGAQAPASTGPSATPRVVPTLPPVPSPIVRPPATPAE